MKIWAHYTIPFGIGSVIWNYFDDFFEFLNKGQCHLRFISNGRHIMLYHENETISKSLKRSLPMISILSPTIKCPSLVTIQQCPFDLAATNNQPTNITFEPEHATPSNLLNSPPSGPVALLVDGAYTQWYWWMCWGPMKVRDHWTSNKGTDRRKNLLFYALCILYVLSVVTVVLDIAFFIYASHWNPTAIIHISFIGTVAGCADFIAQSILIYRCWIVWGCNIRVVILPSILAFVFLVMWLVGANSQYIFSDKIAQPSWGGWLHAASIAMSMTVNALVTGLIIFKIFNVYREVKSVSDDQTSGATGGSNIRSVIFVLIESGMILFSIQLARLVVIIYNDVEAYGIIVFIHQMLNGITPTIILVQVSTGMGLSFHDKESMIESTVGRFVAANPNSIPETGDVGIVNRDDDVGVRLSDDI
ncbi:hypothetical protein BYT27DRAFT_7343968 [Phlegmacium glaucopus]|nr:hypothetical protein BYT27DRAFT_7343968 [Phlegmacium glaucopus]